MVYPGGVPALANLSLRVRRGEFVALLGSSGAGKSTLLRVINGLSVPTSGRVRVDGIPVERRNLPSVRRQVATIFQQARLVGRATVLNNILCGALRDLSPWRAALDLWPIESQRRACALLREVGLKESYLYRRADQLSGGEQQRVGIARAFMAAPRLLLADEPVASLDPATSDNILALLQQLARVHACTVLCSLHQVELARKFADRIVALRAGTVVLDCPTATVKADALDNVYGGN